VLRLRAPLLWPVGCLVGGLCLAQWVPGMPAVPVACCGIPPALAAVWLAGRDGGARSWTCCWCGAALILAWAYGLGRTPPPPEALWRDAPPREVLLDLEVIRVFDREAGSRFQSGIARITNAAYPSETLAGERTGFFLYGPNARIAHRARFRTRAVLYPIAASGDAEGFEQFLLHNHVHFQLRQGAVLAVERTGNAWTRILQGRRDRFTEWLRAGSVDTPHDLHGRAFAGMLLGRRNLLPETQRNRFLRSGVMHLFAISGLHIMAMALTVERALALARVPTRWRPVPGLLVLGLYVAITGSAPSAVRAFLMVVFFWSARGWERQHASLAALCASAVAVLLWQPQQLWSPGFQLSYSVVGSILLLGLPLARAWRERLRLFRDLPRENWSRWHERQERAVRRFLDLLAISWSATLGSAPLTAAYFGVITPGAVLLNMLLVPLAGLAVVNGFLVMLAGSAGLSFVGATLNRSAWVILSMMFGLIDGFLAVPGFFWERELAPGLGRCLLPPLFVWLLWLRRTGRSPGPAPYLWTGAGLFGLLFLLAAPS